MPRSLSSLPPVLCLVGKSGSGKTRLMVSLVKELKRRGYRVATIKHVGDHDFEIDVPGKDSWWHAQAGSDAVVVSSPNQLAVIRKLSQEASLEGILALLGHDFDIVLAEGYKAAAVPKIEVHRRVIGPGLLSAPEGLLAVVTDEPLPVDIPQYPADGVVALAQMVVERLLE